MKLYHSVLCPYSRKAIISIAEKNLACEMIEERIWNNSQELLNLEQTGILPVLVDDACGVNRTISWSIAIDEYLEETYDTVKLIGQTIDERIMVRKLVSWFDQKFYAEVTKNIVFEKVMKRFSKGKGCPNSATIREGLEKIYYHFEYINWLLENNDWLAGNTFSLADISAASHISTIDYLNHVPWNEFPEVKIWYARIKSRPSFKRILSERLSLISPAEHYTNLDF